MSIKPIDLQTNLGQIHEVGRGEQGKTGAIAEQQHSREKEANEHSKLINSKLDEMKKGEQTAIKDEGKNKDKRKSGREGEQEEGDEKDRAQNVEKITDDRLGNLIDVKK